MNDLLRRMLFLPPQSSTEAAHIDQLHYFVIIITMAGAGFVFLLGIVFLIRYRARTQRYSPDETTTPQGFPRWLEVGMAVSLLGLFVLWWVIGFMQYVRIRTPPPDTMDVYVTAKQWMWKFAYPDGRHTLATLYVPSGRPIKLIMTSRDVIHSFFVPDFRLKQDVLPGRYTTLWFQARQPGRHDILCAEFCGTSHSTMRAQVVVLSPTDYARWLSGAQPGSADGAATQSSLVKAGEAASAQQGCLRCHTLDGSPHIGPTWAGMYMSTVPLQDGGKAVADEAFITESMMDPRAKVHTGFAPVMPSYKGLISPADTAAIVELIKSLRGVPGRATTPPPEKGKKP